MLTVAGRTRSVERVNKLLEHCSKLNLPVSLAEAEKLEERFNSMDAAHIADLPNVVKHLASVIHSELGARVFFSLESRQGRDWKPFWLFDSPLRSAFPEAFGEIQPPDDALHTESPQLACFTLCELLTRASARLRVSGRGIRLTQLGRDRKENRSKDGREVPIENRGLEGKRTLLRFGLDRYPLDRPAPIGIPFFTTWSGSTLMPSQVSD